MPRSVKADDSRGRLQSKSALLVVEGFRFHQWTLGLNTPAPSSKRRVGWSPSDQASCLPFPSQRILSLLPWLGQIGSETTSAKATRSLLERDARKCLGVATTSTAEVAALRDKDPVHGKQAVKRPPCPQRVRVWSPQARGPHPSSPGSRRPVVAGVFRWT